MSISRTGTGVVLAVAAGIAPAPFVAGAMPAHAAPSAADVWIDASGSSLPPYVGWRGSLVYVVGNLGPATATGVTATFEIPTGLSVATTTGSCADTPTGQTCLVDLGTRSPGQAPRSSFTVWADTPGFYTIRAAVTADQPDPVPANNVDAVSVLVLPDADMSVQVSDSADPVRPDRPLSYTATVANNGPSPATELTLTQTWSSTVRGSVTLTGYPGVCSPISGTGLRCALGTLAAGAVTTVTITLSVRGTGTVTDTASVAAAEFDPDATNNADSEATLVGTVAAGRQ